jgi:hypothetical protein
MICRKVRGYLVIGAELLLFGVFAFAGVDKFVNNLSFTAALLRTAYLPESWVLPLSVTIPVTEILLVAAGLFTSYTKWVLISMAALLVIFILHLSWINWISPEVPCSCGALFSTVSTEAHILINMGLLLICFFLLRFRMKMHDTA